MRRIQTNPGSSEDPPNVRRRLAVPRDRSEEFAKYIYLAGAAEPAALLELFFMERVRGHHRDTARSPVLAVYASFDVEWEGEVRTVRYPERFRFGRDPCLYARKVKNLREIDGERLDWQDIPVPVRAATEGSPPISRGDE